MFDKIIFLVLSIRYIGKIEKTKCANGSEKLETMEIEGERSTTLKSFNRVLCRFKDCLTLHQWAILSSLINFAFTAAFTSVLIINTVRNMEINHSLKNITAVADVSDSNNQTTQIDLKIRLDAINIPHSCSMGIVLVSSCVLIYGVISKSKWYIFQWIVTTILMNLAFLIMNIVVFSEPGVLHYFIERIIRRAPVSAFVFALVVLIVVAPAWLVIVYYYDILRRMEKQQKAQILKNHDLEGQQIQKV